MIFQLFLWWLESSWIPGPDAAGPVCSLQASGNQSPVSGQRVAEKPRTLQVPWKCRMGAVMHMPPPSVNKSLCLLYILLEFVESILESQNGVYSSSHMLSFSISDQSLNLVHDHILIHSFPFSHPIHPINIFRFFIAHWHNITDYYWIWLAHLAHWRQITAPAVALEKASFIRRMLPVSAAASRVWHLVSLAAGFKWVCCGNISI